MTSWLSLITTLPTENATARMRAWRALKASGAAVLRDGVYLLPVLPDCRSALDAIAAEVITAGGMAYVLQLEALDSSNFAAFFDRNHDYAALLAEVDKLSATLAAAHLPETLKQLRKLRKAWAALVEIDFFPTEAQQQVDTALQSLELAAARVLAPDEPLPIQSDLPRLAASDYQSRVWATRKRPWVDRLGCAWLIRRFIDPQARLLWLDSPADCPADALGFDFDGATFTHVGNRVSFEVLLASFGLQQAGLLRLASLVHFLDVGGVAPAEASGVETVLTGLRSAISDDDLLFSAACNLFDGLFASFQSGTSNS